MAADTPAERAQIRRRALFDLAIDMHAEKIAAAKARRGDYNPAELEQLARHTPNRERRQKAGERGTS